MHRRTFIQSSSIGALAMVMPGIPGYSPFLDETRFGVAEASYWMRWYGKLESGTFPSFTNALEMLEHCASLGFGGIQVGIRNWDAATAKKLRSRAEELGVFLEGQVRLPKDRQETARFEEDLKAAHLAGIDVIRTACLSGRRYEDFDSMESFRVFKEGAISSLQLAEPLIKKHAIKLAVENHKDWRYAEMVEILKNLESEWIGVTLDTGNNISLLEDPMEVVEALAPYAFSVHLKDMGVVEYEDGFLLSEVNLGEGNLDIEGMVRIMKEHNPKIRFNLEMITRDPLKIPCLTKKYWATFDQISASELALFLYKIRNQKVKTPLPIVSAMTTDAQLAMEVENNRTSLEYARMHLGFQ